MWLMKVMRQGSELHGLASYINKYNWLCVFRWGEREAKKTRRGGRVGDYFLDDVGDQGNVIVSNTVFLNIFSKTVFVHTYT